MIKRRARRQDRKEARAAHETGFFLTRHGHRGRAVRSGRHCHGGGDHRLRQSGLAVRTGGSRLRPPSRTEEYGKRLISQTSEYLGPDVADPKMRFMNSRLACASCHIGAGVDPGNLSLAVAFTKYPRISPRSGANETIQDRINGCMMRSMNGRALAENSAEMIAMVAYLRFLADQDAASGAGRRKAHEPAAFKTPNRAAEPQRRRGSLRASVARPVMGRMEPGLRLLRTRSTDSCSRRCGGPIASMTARACTAF